MTLRQAQDDRKDQWLDMLKAAVAASNRQAVADKLRVSRTAISLVLDGKYPARTDKIAAKVLDTYARLTCTHSGADISHADCRSASTADVPTSSPQAMRQWRACQSCSFKGSKL